MIKYRVDCVFFVLVEPINFLVPLEDQEVTVLPGVATFQCEVTKMGLKPEWKHGNDVLSPSDKYQMSSQGGVHKLTITDVWGKDESNYTIIFSKDVESTAKLTVKGKHVYSYGITAIMFVVLKQS